MHLVRIEGLPEAPLAAAADFHARVLPALPRAADLVLAFPQADHSHRAWRLAAVQELAREAAPHRVNAVASAGKLAVGAAMAYLAEAQGVTGQYLPLDDAGAEAVLSSPA